MSGTQIRNATFTWFRGGIQHWDHFWFGKTTNETLALIRIATGLMLFYSHLVLATDLMAFIGPDAWINPETSRSLHDGRFGTWDAGWTYLWSITNPNALWLHHLFTLLVTAAFAAGFLTRLTGPLAWFLQLMYLHRLTGALFGLDQIVTYAAMYLALTPCGSCFSVDAWIRNAWRKRKGERSDQLTDTANRGRWDWLFPENTPSVSANLGTRLFQIHLCVIYLFGGLAKARGETWWDGTAIWFAVANYEYQSLDLTWIGRYPRLFSLLTHATLFWEIFYCALVWPKWSRPVILFIAVCVHGGIAIGLGMMTFGCMMIVANAIFIPAEFTRRCLSLKQAT